jgi:hypothetical protein
MMFSKKLILTLFMTMCSAPLSALTLNFNASADLIADHASFNYADHMITGVFPSFHEAGFSVSGVPSQRFTEFAAQLTASMLSLEPVAYPAYTNYSHVSVGYNLNGQKFEFPSCTNINVSFKQEVSILLTQQGCVVS